MKATDVPGICKAYPVHDEVPDDPNAEDVSEIPPHSLCSTDDVATGVVPPRGDECSVTADIADNVNVDDVGVDDINNAVNNDVDVSNDVVNDVSVNEAQSPAVEVIEMSDTQMATLPAEDEHVSGSPRYHRRSKGLAGDHPLVPSQPLEYSWRYDK